ncbi:MAG: ABC transporter ATP-binding protein [Bacilli bacterium]|nr:ABC transporter ATP-binding protein [Bacilli bacterium]
MKSSVLLKKLFKYTREYRLKYIIALLLMVGVVGVNLLIPYILGKTIDLLSEDPVNLKMIITLAVVGFVSTITLGIMYYFEAMMLSRVGNRIVYKIREEVIIHIQKFSHSQFNEVPIGKLVTRVTSDVTTLYELYTNILISLLRNIFTIAGVFVAMFVLNWRLALIMLAIVPVIALFAFIFQYFSRKAHRKVRDNVSNMNAFLSENISGIKLTQVFNEETKKYGEFKKNNGKLRRSLVNEIFVFGIFRPSIYVLYVVSTILVFWFGGKLVMGPLNDYVGGTMTVGLLYSFYQYIWNFFGPIQALADQYNELQSSYAAAEKIFTILDTKLVVDDEPDAIEMEIKGDIEFKDVWFSYIPGTWVLKGVSFHIKPEETIAFVGATGSGKTTILSLIVRNYDIQKGQILIDGVDIKHIKLECLRSQVGQMLQDVFLFSGTIESNISMNDGKFSHEEVVEASTFVNASKFIDKLPNGYSEEVRERGNNFSLGQRQLISFARTVVHKPKVMILDEATANIDTETEVLIQDSLKKIMTLGTVIVVAHRLSTIQHANCIYVFKQGEIIEQGTHQELLANKGRYYDLYRLQFEEE